MNFLPTLLFFIFVAINALENGTAIRGENTIVFYFSIPLFLMSCFFNLSFFFLKIGFVRNNKTISFLSYYLSSICCFVISLLFVYWFIMGRALTAEMVLKSLTEYFWLIHIYFFINFFLVFFYKRKIAKMLN